MDYYTILMKLESTKRMIQDVLNILETRDHLPVPHYYIMTISKILSDPQSVIINFELFYNSFETSI